MRRQPQQLQKRQRGAVAVVVGLTIFVLVGMIGLALDSGQLFVNKTELQNAADACALAAARELDGNADALTRADAAGVLVGTQNLVGFQDAAVALTAADISYSENLSPNSAYQTSDKANPATSKFAMCEVERDDIGMWFMGVFGYNDPGKKPRVSAYAVATLAPSQTTCAVPIGVCKEAGGGSAPTFGLVVGKWYGGKFGPDESGTTYTGSYNWIDFTVQNGWEPEDKQCVSGGGGGGADEIQCLLSGPGQCELPPVGTPVGQQGQIGSTADAWNTRFGLYKEGEKYNETNSPPDFTGIAYVQAGIGIGAEIGKPGSKVVETWPNSAPQNAYSGMHPDGTTLNYQSAKADNESYQILTNPAGIDGIKAYDASTAVEYFSSRRIALAPVVNCEDLAGSTPQTVKVEGYVCVLMLNPIKAPADVALEYLGPANDPNSPCSSFGLAGGTTGPLVPVLVQ
jgi:hypothetical protein